MNLLLHNALKDLRAVRGPLALWLGVLVADTAAQALKLDRLVPPDRFDDAGGALLVVGVSLLAFGWVVAAMIVQADPLDNPSAFWLTRPLSPGALLAGKLLVILPLFLLLPVAAATTVVAANGVRGALLLRFALERLAVDAALLMPVLLAASVAHNLARMILVLTGGGLIYAIVHGLATMRWLFAAGARTWTRLRARAIVGVLVAMALSVVGSLALIDAPVPDTVHSSHAVVGAVSLALVVSAGDFWPWNLLPDPLPARVDSAVFDPAGVHLSLDPDGLRRGDATTASVRVAATGGRSAGRPSPRIETRGFLRAEGVPPGWVVRVLKGTGEARLGGRTIASAPYGVYAGDTPYSRRYPGAGLSGDVMLAFEQALRARIVNSDRTVEGISVHLFDLEEAVFQRQQGIRGSLRATLVMEAQRVVAGAPIPLVPGASGQVDGEGVTVIDTPRDTNGHLLTVRLARAQVRTAGEPRTHLLLRNRRTGEAFFPAPENAGTTPFGLLPNDMRVAPRTLAVPGTVVPIDAGWLADAELVIAVIEPAGTFEKQLVLDEFVLPTMYYYR